MQALKSLETSGLNFAKDDKRGYLTFCPTNLGTAMRASVHIKVPKLQAAKKLDAICADHHLQPRGKKLDVMNSLLKYTNSLKLFDEQMTVDQYRSQLLK